MKRLFLTVALVLLLATGAFAASTQTTIMTTFDTFIVVEVSWTAHTDGSYDNYSIPDYIVKAVRGQYCWYAVTDPGTTAPTDNYDITLLDGYSVDILGGNLADRDTSNSEQEVLGIGTSTVGSRPVWTGLTLTISNNSVNAATGKVAFVFTK